MLRVLSLFAGIGGFDLGLERTGGFKTVAFCEIDPFCRRVLAKHWPGVPCYDDVRTLTADRLAADGIAVDVICGGFPCQDISTAGAGAGIEGERSGLWSEYARLIGELRPRYVIVENVAALLARGLDKVLGDLAARGYDAEWDCIPAAAVGAPHRRDRLWLVGYPGGTTGERHPRTISGEEAGERSPRQQDGHLLVGPEFAGAGCGARHLAYPEGLGCGQGRQGRAPTLSEMRAAKGRALADTARILAGRKKQRPVRERAGARGQPISPGEGWRLAEPSMGGMVDGLPSGLDRGLIGAWDREPDIPRVAAGVPERVSRLRSLGNAVVPQIPELIGRAILEAREA